MTAPQGGAQQPPPSRGKQAAQKSGGILKKIIIGFVVLVLLCCTPCGAIAFVAGFSGVNSVVSLLMQNECPQQPGGATGPGNVNVPEIVQNPPPALAGKTFPTAGGGTVAYDAERVRNAWILLDVAKQRQMSEYGILIAFVVAVKESHFKNYREAVDHDSLGIFQQRPSTGWGKPEELTNVWYASNAFFGGPHPPNNTGLVDVKGWEDMKIHEAAEKVQRSAVTQEADYTKHLPEAQAILAYLGNPVQGVPVAGGTSGGCTTTVGGLRARIVQIAQNEVGYKPASENCTKYVSTCVEWCAVFTQWVWKTAGVNPVFDTWFARGVAHQAITSNGRTGTWKPHTMGTRDGNPLPGDALIYGTPSPDGPGHVGLVVKVHPDGLIDTIEGNTGNDQVSYNTKLDPATLNNGSSQPLSGYVAPPGG